MTKPRQAPGGESPPHTPALTAATTLPELEALHATLALAGQHMDVRVERQVTVADTGSVAFPLYCITLGNPDPQVPAIGFFGGVHGLERIGSEVAIAFLHSIAVRLQWDDTLHRLLESVRLVFMPIINPGGMWMGTRANPRGVDLMRNAPIDAGESVPYLVGGQRISSALPWFRGRLGEPMEAENQALCAVVERELLSHPFSIALDCHSGFGVRDRIWFPYAHTREPIAHLAEMQALKHIFRQTYNHHAYVFEPQSLQYLAHGDVWDYLYQQACTQAGRVFLPLTLEMGSWLWIKKNPRQMFSLKGLFNPLIEHRQNRVLRRHLALMDFLTRAAASHAMWSPRPCTREDWNLRAIADWYS